MPYWDFNAPDIPNAPRDASAACVVASALLEMFGFYGNEQGEKYKEAEKMLCSLSSDKYQSRDTNVAFLYILPVTGQLSREIDTLSSMQIITIMRPC